MHPTNLHFTRRQRGTTLFEALVAFLVLSLGMLTVARVQTHLRINADVARQGSEAVRLAQEELETIRAFASLAASAGTRSYEAIASRSRTVDSGTGYNSNTRYQVARQIDAAIAPNAKNALITVSWTDRNGGAQRLALSSIIAGNDPAYSGALALARGGAAVQGPLGRSVAIPPGAKDLGNGSSVFKPVSDGSVAYLFNNGSGQVTGRCSGVVAATATRDLTTGNLGSCDANVGVLLSGSVRFSSAVPPDAAQANDPPLAAAVSLALAGGSYAIAPDCSTQAMKTVAYTTSGSLHLDAVAIGASAASMGLPGWTETGERHLAYHCVVYPLPSGRWSGRAALVATGWTIGTSATDRRVCRYSGDLDGNGSIDANIEHPASYAGVEGALAHQNFLVINGTQTCPSGNATRVTGSSSDVFADLGTAPHQP